MRELSLFFGSDIYAASITLAAFMGGLALGGYLVGLYADKMRYPIFYYGIIEIAIGTYAFVFRPLLDSFDPFIAASYTTLFDPSPTLHHLTRFGIASIILIIPTILMGTTLPMVLKAFTHRQDKLGETTGHFYAINTFGALSGVLLAGFVLMPKLGLSSTNLVAVIMNLSIGSMSILLQAKCFQKTDSKGLQFHQSGAIYTVEVDSKASGIDSDRVKTAFIAIGISGFGGLALEVIWTRVLIQSFSATVYSFSIMLVCFLLGIAVGSKVISRQIDSSKTAIKLFAKIEIGIGLSVVLLAGLSFAVPRLFGNFVWGLTNLSPELFGFASVLGAFTLSLIVILPSTILLGAAFPAALKAYNLELSATGKDSGRILFINTIGSVLGALVTGLVIIPLIGSRSAMLLLSMVFLLNGIYIQRLISDGLTHALRKFAVPTTLSILLIVIVAFMPYRAVLNYNMQKDTRHHILYHSEGVSGFVDIIRTSSGETVLSINGNREADNSLRQLRHFILKAHLPLLLSSGAQEVLVVGLGLGITTSSLLKHPNVKRVDVVELSPDIVDAQRYISDINGDVLSDPRVHLRIDDGRNFLKFTENRYDLITADPIHPRISGVGMLYTKEYYQLIFDRLKDSGTVLQWMPVYSISQESFVTAVRTMTEVFPYTSVWYIPGHTLLLSAKTKKAIFDYETLRSKFSDQKIASDLKTIGIGNMLDLLQLQILSPVQLQKLLDREPMKIINTEDLPYLEYHTPFEFLTPPAVILKWLLAYSQTDGRSIENAPAGFVDCLVDAQETYRTLIQSRRRKSWPQIICAPTLHRL